MRYAYFYDSSSGSPDRIEFIIILVLLAEIYPKVTIVPGINKIKTSDLNVFEQILKVGVFIGCVDCASKLLGI
jgi:hypothetical protein